MFGYSLSHEQERRVLELLGYVATSDREVTEDERQYVVNLSHDFNASADGIFEIAEEKSLQEICSEFDDETARRIAFIYVARLGAVDGWKERGDWRGVQNVAEACGLSSSDAAELEDWARRGLQWEEEGRKLLGLPPKWEA